MQENEVFDGILMENSWLTLERSTNICKRFREAASRSPDTIRWKASASRQTTKLACMRPLAVHHAECCT